MKLRMELSFSFLFLLFCMFSIPLSGTAFAYSVNLAYNNLNLTGSVGTFTVTDNGANDVQISLLMNPGYSLKIQDGPDFNFNSNSGIQSVNIDSMTVGSTLYTSALSTTLASGQQADGFGNFSVNLTGIKCGSCPGGTASVDQLVFDVIYGRGYFGGLPCKSQYIGRYLGCPLLYGIGW